MIEIINKELVKNLILRNNVKEMASAQSNIILYSNMNEILYSYSEILYDMEENKIVKMIIDLDTDESILHKEKEVPRFALDLKLEKNNIYYLINNKWYLLQLISKQ